VRLVAKLAKELSFRCARGQLCKQRAQCLRAVFYRGKTL